MNIHEAVEMYSQGEIDGVSPLSEVDGKIILKLIELFKTMGLSSEFQKIVSQWKVVSDDEILERLEKFSGEWVTDKDFFMIDENISIPISHLMSIGRKEIASWGVSTPVIIVNETDNEKVVNSNIIIRFKDSKERDLHYRSLMNRLESFTKIRFL